MNEKDEALDKLREELRVKAIVLVTMKKVRGGYGSRRTSSSGLLDQDLINLMIYGSKADNFLLSLRWERTEKLDDCVKKACIERGAEGGFMLTVNIIENTRYVEFGIYKLSDFGVKKTVPHCIQYIKDVYEHDIECVTPTKH